MRNYILVLWVEDTQPNNFLNLGLCILLNHDVETLKILKLTYTNFLI